MCEFLRVAIDQCIVGWGWVAQATWNAGKRWSRLCCGEVEEGFVKAVGGSRWWQLWGGIGIAEATWIVGDEVAGLQINAENRIAKAIKDQGGGCDEKRLGLHRQYGE